MKPFIPGMMPEGSPKLDSRALLCYDGEISVRLVTRPDGEPLGSIRYRVETTSGKAICWGMDHRYIFTKPVPNGTEYWLRLPKERIRASQGTLYLHLVLDGCRQVVPLYMESDAFIRWRRRHHHPSCPEPPEDCED